MDLRIGFVFCLSLSSVLATRSALLLTPYIKNNAAHLANTESQVNSTLFLNVTSHSGFITVNEKYNSNLFFWYFPVANVSVSERPLIIWLQGGPGATSLAGLFEEIGPFRISNSKLQFRQDSWVRNHSLLFIDNPVGAGYSFTDSQDGFVQDMDTCADQLYNFLQQFLTVFPELRASPIYIAGESYAGRYIPAFAQKVLKTEDSHHGETLIYLKGLIMGSPVFNHHDIADYTKMFLQWGLIDTQGALAVKPLQDSYLKAMTENDNAKSYEYRDQLMSKLESISMQPQMYNVLKNEVNVGSFVDFVTSKKIRQAIHVGDLTFTFSNETVHTKLIPDFLTDINPKIDELLDHYRVLIYCGQLDMIASCVDNAEARRESWTWSRRDHFLSAPRTPWWSSNAVAGYVKSGGGLTEVLVKGAGHFVPMDKPAETLEMISYFIRDLDLLLPINYKPDPKDTPEYKELDIFRVYRVIYDKTGYNISIFFNVLFAVLIIGGLVYFFKMNKYSRLTENA